MIGWTAKDCCFYDMTRFESAYDVIYRVEESSIFVAAIMHLKREPFYWNET